MTRCGNDRRDDKKPTMRCWSEGDIEDRAAACDFRGSDSKSSEAASIEEVLFETIFRTTKAVVPDA